MSKPARRRWRVHFRRFRIAVLVAFLAFLLVLIYLSRVGVPDFVKRPLLGRLRAHGVAIEFTRLRLRFDRGLVAENVRFGRDQEPASTRLLAREVEVKVNYLALARFQFQVESLGLRNGRCELPTETNALARPLVVENIQTDLRFLPGDQWALDNFQAVFAGARFTMSGTITNASEVRNWEFLHARQPPRANLEQLRRLADTLEKIHFIMPPDLRLTVHGDARDLQSFAVKLTLNAPDADTPWGEIAHGVFVARLVPAGSNDSSHAEISLTAAAAHTPWCGASNLNLAARLVSMAGETNLADCDLTLRASRVETKWAIITNAQFTAGWVHSLTNAIPIYGHGELRATTAMSRWADARDIQITASLAPAANPPAADAAWGWWRRIQPYDLDWTCHVTQLQAENLDADKVVCAGRWRAPTLAITNLFADFHDGTLDAHAQLDVITREARFDLVSDFDVHKIGPFLTEKTRRWLAKYEWIHPPRLAGSGSAILPAWVPPWRDHPDWHAEVQPTVRLTAEFAVTNGAYLGVAADWARSHVTYSNLFWRLPDLDIGRPEGQIHLMHEADDRTKDYYWRIRGTIDPLALRPLLSTNAQRGLDLFKFTGPPTIDGEVWGWFYQYDLIGFSGRVAVTNCSFRGQTASSFESALHYTNRVLEFLDPRALRGTQVVSASAVTVDLNAQRVYFTNGFSTAEPQVVASAIGPKTAHALEPYRFTQPPAVRVSGSVPFRGVRDADLHFEVDGGPFECWKLKTPHIAGDVHWLGEKLMLTNLQTAFYGGKASGAVMVDFTPETGAGVTFDAAVTDAKLQLLMADISAHTNQLEGLLSGRLVMASDNSTNKQTWNGYGRANLRDGLIWEIPIFGVLSKPLNSVVPGLGSSRASEGSARFLITNGVIYSDKVEVIAPALRLQYGGTVDFNGQINAHVQAEFLRDTWVFGRIISTVLLPVTKLFEFKITGTLSQPKSEPVFIPNMFLHPFRTLEELFIPESTRTNAPAGGAK